MIDVSRIDWAEEWKMLQAERKAADNAEHWTKRAATFSNLDAPSSYTLTFIERMGIEPGESVFDMGCGNGALAIPLAKRGHHVFAGDFSSGMIEALEEEAAKRGLANSIQTKLFSWDDNWAELGIKERFADIAIASRSIATADLRAAILKLSGAARRKACITIATEDTPRSAYTILHSLGAKHAGPQDYIYAFNILIAEGFHPQLSYIESSMVDTFSSQEDAEAYLRKMIDGAYPLISREDQAVCRGNIQAWVSQHLVANETVGRLDRHGEPEGAYKFDLGRPIRWAFISWDVKRD